MDLEVGSGSHAQQTGAVMQRFEPVCLDVKPDLVLVYGDVNSTVAAALVAAKLGIRVAHVEAGLRSRDWTMPEERIHFVGNVMIDSLVYALPRARKLNAASRLGLREQGYVIVTLHRPSNVDQASTLSQLLDALGQISRDRPVIFPAHPRTRERIRTPGNPRPQAGDLRLLEPMAYTEMLSLVASAELVITDSGGLQEETSFLGIPCVTVRPIRSLLLTAIGVSGWYFSRGTSSLSSTPSRGPCRSPLSRVSASTQN